MQAKPLAFFFASFLLLCFYWASFLKTEHSLFNAGFNAKRAYPPWGLVILLQSVLTYTYRVLYTLRMELQGDTSKFWQNFFKVLASRFEVVIYIFSQFLGSCSFLSCRQEIYDKALVFCSLSAAKY